MQTRLQSLVETAANIAVGFLLSVLTSYAIFKLKGIPLKLIENIEITFYFTVVSVIRSYAIRRWFNHRHKEKNNNAC